MLTTWNLSNSNSLHLTNCGSYGCHLILKRPLIAFLLFHMIPCSHCVVFASEQLSFSIIPSGFPMKQRLSFSNSHGMYGISYRQNQGIVFFLSLLFTRMQLLESSSTRSWSVHSFVKLESVSTTTPEILC